MATIEVSTLQAGYSRRVAVAVRFRRTLTALVFVGTAASAEPAPQRLDEALSGVLALGDAAGCSAPFNIPAFGTPEEHDQALKTLRDNGQLGKELAAVCGSSAVSSAAALGGSLGSVQATKTVSQFRLARRRVDSRLDLRGKRFGLGGTSLFAALDEPALPKSDALLDAPIPQASGLSVFVQGEHEQRERANTLLETGYDAKLSSFLIGLDYASEHGFIAGAWAGYGSTNADYGRANLLVGGAVTSELSGSLTPALIADLCKIGPGGEFSDDGGKLGAFLGARFGGGFADVALQYSRRSYDYRRNLCTIETAAGAIEPSATSRSGFKSGTQDIDDVFAGSIFGDTRLREWSVSARAGYNFGDERLLWGPRLSLTYARSKIDAFIERGRTSVTHTVLSALGDIETNRAPGDPTGLELAFDAQSRTSLQSELQLVAAHRFELPSATIIPRISASWIHEFEAERERVAVRLAQDLRPEPVRFSFTTDSADKDKGVIALGFTALRGARFAADVEIAHLLADDRFDSTRLTAQARWRF
jgi:hypothetical protein